MNVQWFLAFPVLIALLYCFDSCKASNHIVVVSYNLWNVMFQWDVRKLYIADMLRNVNADIIGLRDVRAKKDKSHTQLDELQRILPEYGHKYFLPLKYINKQHLRPGWEWEGIGFLSRHKILTVATLNLSIPLGSPDKNRKTLLHAQFFIEPDELEIDVLLLQLSYDKKTQCSNAFDVTKYIYNIGVESVVVMGDFKVYEEFNTPIKAIANGKFENGTLCEDTGKIFHQDQYRLHEYKFIDAWANKHSNHHGFTYSNLPVPGFIGRPDRILVSTVGLKVESSLILGKGTFYAHNYGSQLRMNRYMQILRAAQEGKFRASQNSTCVAECGPRGSCRCGICISGGNKNSCKPNECSECSPSKLFILHAVFIALVPCLFFNTMFFLLLVLGVVRPKWRRTLINKLRMRKFTSCILLCVTSCIIICLLIYAKFQFEDISRLVDMQMMNELHPSNHLMVVAKLELI